MRLRRIVTRLSRLYVVKVTVLELFRQGYVMLMAAPAARPSRATVEARFRAYYGERGETPDFGDPVVLDHWAERLRDISQFCKDMEPAFTNWLNQIRCGGRRQGTGWCGRFKSVILGSARRVFAVLSDRFWDGTARLGRARSCHGSVEQSAWRRFEERHPWLAELLADTGKIGGALCLSMATGTCYPLKSAFRGC